MTVSPFVFKSQATRALKGNWQTALLVSFLASLPNILVELTQSTKLSGLSVLYDPEAARQALLSIPSQTWTLLGFMYGLEIVLMPMLSVSANHYFVSRLRGSELGLSGVVSRWRITGKAMLLYILMAIKIFLWSLLLVVPGVIAFIRYSMAPYYLAEEPDIGVLDALRRSKQAMKDNKMTYFTLGLSFIGWYLAVLLSNLLLGDLNVILAMVVSQFISLYMVTYFNASEASFYLALSTQDGMHKARREADAWLSRFGINPFGGHTASRDHDPDDPDKPDDQN